MVLAVASLAVLVVVATGGDDNDDVAVEIDDESITTSDEDSSTTTTSDPTTVTASETSLTDVESTTTTTQAPSTTATAFVTQERCASNTVSSPDDLSVEACVVDRARVGETVRVRIRASDGNAQVRDDCGSPWVDWGESEQATCTIGCGGSTGPSAPSSIDVTREHVYTEPGQYPVRVVVESNCGKAPFGDIEDVQLGLVEVS